MTRTIAGITIPDSAMAREAAELVREASSDLLIGHVTRTFLFGALLGTKDGVDYDPELLWVGAQFHDLGLTDTYRRTDQRFEIDAADEARAFLSSHGIGKTEADRIWTAIALHTTPEIPLHMGDQGAEIPLVTRGVELDVMGVGYDLLTDDERAAILEAYPRVDFKEGIIAAFSHGIAPRPETTFGNVKADVLEETVPDFVRGNFVEKIRDAAWAH